MIRRVLTLAVLFYTAQSCVAQHVTSSAASVRMLATVRPLVEVRGQSPSIATENFTVMVASVGEGRFEISGSLNPDRDAAEIIVPLLVKTNVRSVLYRIVESDTALPGEISIQHGQATGRSLPISAGRVVGMGSSSQSGVEQPSLVHMKISTAKNLAVRRFRLVIEVLSNGGSFNTSPSAAS